MGIHTTRRLMAVAAVVGISGLCHSDALATTYTWTSGANGNWSNTGDWNPNGTPNAAGAIVDFGGASSGTTTVDAVYTVGILQESNTNTGKYWYIQPSPGNYLILNDTGGSKNAWGVVANAIQNVNHSFLEVNTDVQFTASDLYIGNTIQNGSLIVGGSIINSDATNHNLYLRTFSTGVITCSGSIGGTGGGGLITIYSDLGTNTVNLSGVLGSYVGGLNVSANTVVISGTGGNTYSGLTSVTSGALELNKSGGALALSGSLSVGGGTVVLMAANQLASNTALTINGGSLNLGGNNQTVDAFGGNGGTLTSTTGTPTFTIGSAGGGGNFSGVIAGSITLVKQGAGTTVLSGNDTYSGATTINNGTLQLGSASALGAGGNLTVNGGLLDLHGFSLGVGTLTGAGVIDNLAGGGNTLTVGNGGNNTFSGAIQNTVGSIALTKTGAGTLTLTDTNTYSGATTINNGMLQLGNNNALPGGNLIFGGSSNPATLDMNGFNATVGALSGGTNAVVDIVSSGGASTLTAGNNNASSTFTGVLQNSTGTLALIKMGSGTLTLGGANSYGGTTISGGVLDINGDSALGAAASGLTFSGNSTLQAGAGNILLSSSRGLTVNNGVTATIDTQTNNMTIAGVIGGPGAVTKIGNGVLTLAGTNLYTGGTAVSAGTLYVNSALAASDTATVAPGATLGGQGTANVVNVLPGGSIEGGQYGAGTFSPAVLNFSGSANYNLTVGAAGSSYVPLSVTGSNGLSTTGTDSVLINLPAGEVLTTGTYHLIQYSGVIEGSGSAAFELHTIFENPRELSANLVPESGYIDLNYVADTVTWTSSTSTEWSTRTVAENFITTAGRQATFFLAADVVIFDNSAGTNTVVDINHGNVTPASVTFNNDASHPYTLQSSSGPYGIADYSSPTTLTKTGAGMLTITTPANSYTGGTFLEQGTIVVGVGNALPTAGALIMGSTSTSGTLDLAGNSQQVNGLSVAAGAVPANQVIGNSSTNSTATLIYGGPAASSFGGTIQDAIGNGNQHTALAVSGGLLNLSGSNTYTGGTTISAGTLQLGNLAALGTGGVEANGGVLDLNANSIGVPSLSGSAGVITDNYGSGSGTTTLTVNQASSTTFGGALVDGPHNLLALTVSVNGMLTLAGTSTYTGGTTLSAGTLQAGSNTAFGSSNSPMAVNSGVLDVGGNSVSVGNLSGAGGTILNNGGSAGTFAVGSGSYAGVIADGASQLALSKVGSGLLVLNVANAYSGATSVSGGTLQIQGSGALPAASPINLGSGVLQILNDGSGSGGTISLVNNNITLSLGTTADVIAVGNLATSNSGNTVAFGVLSNGTTANDLKSTINFTAANGYLQSYTGLNLPGLLGATTTLNPTSTTVSITGPVTNQETSTAGGHYDMLDLDGTSAGNLISGVISNSATASVNTEDTRLVKSNTSVWILTASNTYVGPTVISGGTLQLGTGASGQDGSINYTSGVTNNAALVYDLAGNESGSYAISGSGSLTKLGAGMLTLAGSSSYTGGTTLSAGTLQAGGNLAFGSSNSPMAVNSGVLDIGGNSVSVGNLSGAGGTILNNGGSAGTFAVGSGSYGGVIADGASQLALSKVGSGLLVLNVANAYSGATSVNGGTLQFQGSSALPAASPINLGSGVLQILNDGSGSGGTISLVNNNITLSLGTTADVIAVGNLATSNSGNTVAFGVLSNGTTANAFKSTINFTAANGYLQSYTGLNLPGLAGATTTLNPTSTTVSITGPVTNQETSTVGGHYDMLDLDGTSAGNLISGVISNSPAASVNYEDTRLTKSNTGVWILTASNTYVGPTVISGGTLQLGTGASGQDGSINYTSGVTNNAALVYDLAGSQTASYLIQGSGSLTMTGTGFLTLGGANGYGGGTQIESGTLQLGNPSALGTGALAANGGTLDLAGNSILVPSFSGAAGVVTNSFSSTSGTLTVSQTAATTFSGAITDGNGQMALALSGGTLTLSGTNSYSGGTTVSGEATLIVMSPEAIDANDFGTTNLSVGSELTLFGTVQPAAQTAASASSPVPEPGTLALFTAVVCGAAVYHRLRLRRKKR